MDELWHQTREVIDGKPPTTEIFPYQVLSDVKGAFSPGTCVHAARFACCSGELGVSSCITRHASSLMAGPRHQENARSGASHPVHRRLLCALSAAF